MSKAPGLRADAITETAVGLQSQTVHRRVTDAVHISAGRSLGTRYGSNKKKTTLLYRAVDSYSVFVAYFQNGIRNGHLSF